MQTGAHGYQRWGQRKPARDFPRPRIFPVHALIGVFLVLSLAATRVSADDSAPSDIDFTSAEAAFSATFIASGLAARAYRENREYAAAIYQLPDGSWHCTAPQGGSRTESAIPYHAVPASALHIVGAHTHGQPHIPEDPAHVYGADFSQADLHNAVHNYRITHGRIDGQLLLTSDLRILRLTLSGDPDMAMGEAFVTSSQQARLSPGAVHGMMEYLGAMTIPAEYEKVSRIAPLDSGTN